MPSLEERLKGIDHPSLLTGVSRRSSVGDRRVYTANRFPEWCGRYAHAKGYTNLSETFAWKIVEQTHKKIVENIAYGMMQAGNIPANIVNRLEPWEATYFMAGMNSLDPTYNPGDIPDFTQDKEPDKIVARIIVRGMDLLHKRHAKAMAEAPKHHHTTIKSELKLPYEKDIRKYCSDIIWRPEKKPVTQRDLFRA